MMQLRGRQRTDVPRAVLRKALRLIPANGDLLTFVAEIANLRGRPIKLLPWALGPTAPSGLWIARDGYDVIVHAAGVQEDRRRGIVCHEIAHMLLDHKMDDVQARELVKILAPDIDPDVALRILAARHGYEDKAEADAETFGTYLSAALAQSADGPSERVAQRLR